MVSFIVPTRSNNHLKKMGSHQISSGSLKSDSSSLEYNASLRKSTIEGIRSQYHPHKKCWKWQNRGRPHCHWLSRKPHLGTRRKHLKSECQDYPIVCLFVLVIIEERKIPSSSPILFFFLFKHLKPTEVSTDKTGR